MHGDGDNWNRLAIAAKRLLYADAGKVKVLKDICLLYKHQWNTKWAFERKLDIFTCENNMLSSHVISRECQKYGIIEFLSLRYRSEITPWVWKTDTSANNFLKAQLSLGRSV